MESPPSPDTLLILISFRLCPRKFEGGCYILDALTLIGTPRVPALFMNGKSLIWYDPSETFHMPFYIPISLKILFPFTPYVAYDCIYRLDMNVFQA